MMKLVSFLLTYWKFVVTFLALAVLAVVINIQSSTIDSLQAKIQDDTLTRQGQQLARAESLLTQMNGVLARLQAQQQRGEQLATDLLAAQNALQASSNQIQQEIPHVTSSDGNAFTGIGPDSLQLYRSALGYGTRGTGGEHLPEAASGHAERPGHATTAPVGKSGGAY